MRVIMAIVTSVTGIREIIILGRKEKDLAVAPGNRKSGTARTNISAGRRRT
jgi:hypothetical protein